MARIMTKLRRNVSWYVLPAFTTIVLIVFYFNPASRNHSYNDRIRLSLETEDKPGPVGGGGASGGKIRRDEMAADDVDNKRDPNWSCSKQLTLLTPSMGPFKAWREYKQLKELFGTNTVNGVPAFQLRCPVQRCNLTVGATLKDENFLKDSDGVVINIAPSLLKNKLDSTVNELSRKLDNDVSWFFLGMESPQMFTYWDTHISKISYHFEITYHSQSSLPVPYGFFVPSDPMDLAPKDWSKGKTHLIAWMASNCDNTFWPRSEFVHDLLNYIPIDMYGKCGNLTCLPPMSPECNNMLNKYKFYLALENTECDEYITEKFWDNCLKSNVVPVVYGGRRAAYERLAPPNSFIHVGDFKTTQELADYLLELDRDDAKYQQYFQWRLKGHVNTNYPPFNPNAFCGSIPYLDSTHAKTKRLVSESNYFSSCRERPSGVFSQLGSYDNWSPWN